MDKKFYVGLDIGTNSCGFAVTDEKYNLIKAKGKEFWGVRLFEDAKTAEDRRLKRGNRRRLDRRQLKLKWLQELFSDEINKIDPNFFDRLKFSSLFLEDKLLKNKKLTSKDSLFFGTVNDNPYLDKTYYDEYPTIYHLRKELLTVPAKDVRFLYLALHNIIKHRGNFLYEGDVGDNVSITEILCRLAEVIKNCETGEILLSKFSILSKEDENDLFQALTKIKKIREKKSRYCEIFKVESKANKALVESFVDGNIDIKNIFGEFENIETKINFNAEDYEILKYPELEEILTENQLNIIQIVKQIIDTLNLKKIIKNNNFICETMVDIFNTHKSQLNNLKQFIKEFYPNEKYYIFKNPLNNSKDNYLNYAKYVGNDLICGDKQVLGLGSEKSRDKDLFYKYLKSILAKPVETFGFDSEKYESQKTQILEEIENGTYLQRQRGKDNSIFPNKLYLKELHRILITNAEKFSFLKNIDNEGLSVSEKIEKILSFRIPYFVGPIGSNCGENSFSWSEKECDLEIKPWTFEKIINFDKSEEKFIKKMTNKCSYLLEEDVLPKQSLTFSKFKVLNELNKLTINGNPISLNTKQRIFNSLFKNFKRVSISMLRKCLKCECGYECENLNNLNIGGIDKEFANNLGSFIVFKNIFGEEFVNLHEMEIEKIILYHTIISDKNRLENRIKKEFGKLFDDGQIKKIKSLNFSGWGSFSYKFLNGIVFVKKDTGEVTTIINELWSTNKNIQQILFDSNYTLGEELDKINKRKNKSIEYDDVQNMYCSPSVKRGVWQALKVVKEIEQIMGNKPSKIFVEVTRSDEEKGDFGRKLSRAKNLSNMYKSKEFLDSVKITNEELTELQNELSKRDDASLRSEKLYLYFLQCGKCAYSGNSIDISKLYNEHCYDVDHIIPQSIIKDDGIENKVLVERVYNAYKGDEYPISKNHPDWITKQKSFWQMLKNAHLMSEKKYNNLIRTNELSNEDLGGFIARQLVETNQSSKAVIDILKQYLDNPRGVVYSKAGFVSEFRTQNEIFKDRNVNDFHHSRDAYLNIVVGNVLFSRFTDDPRNFYRNKNNNNKITKNTKKLFENEIRSNFSDDVVWKGKEDIDKVKSICLKTGGLVSFMNYKANNGQFYDESIYKSELHNSKTSASISLKGNKNNPLSNIEKYGGYNSSKTAYFMIVESKDKKGNLKRTIENVPIFIYQKFAKLKDRDTQILNYLISENSLIEPKVLIPILNIKSTLKIGDGEYLLAGKTNNRYILHNANEWRVDNETMRYIKVIEKLKKLKNENKINNLKEINEKVVVSPASKDGNKEISLTKFENEALYEKIKNQLSKSIYRDTALGRVLKPKIDEYEVEFKTLSVINQALAIFDIISGLSTGATPAIINGSKVGVILISKDITNLKIKFIQKSVTGIMQKEIKF